MPHASTSLSSWVKVIASTLELRGIDSRDLLRQAGLDPAALGDPNARYPLTGTTALWRLAVTATGDESLGLAVSGNVRQTSFHALGYSLLASATLKEAFERLIRYFRIVSDAGELEFAAAGPVYRFVIHPLPGPQQPADEAIDAMMGVIYRLCRLLTERTFQARQLKFRRPTPRDPSRFQQVFNAPLEFQAAETALYMDARTAHQSLEHANPELARHNDEILARYLSTLDRQQLANRTHAVLVGLLPLGDPSQDKVAAALHMSPRNLQRKLGDEGTSYSAILNQTRRELALSYMADERYSLSEITYLLGFADSSSFSRAFRRWTGQAPSRYRA